MTPLPIPSPLRRRLVIASGLALCTILLTAAGLITGGRVSSETPAARKAAEAGIAAAIDSLCPLYAIDVRLIRSWKATAAGEPTGRIEEKIPVDPGFRSLEFNHALALRIAPFGAGVVATERSKENSVTMHVVRGGATIRSLWFVPDAGR
ncbi:MAG TPA: hypothetical protein VF514_13360 [Bacteroidota bacterium]